MYQLASWHIFILVYPSWKNDGLGTLGPQTVNEIPHLIKEIDRWK